MHTFLLQLAQQAYDTTKSNETRMMLDMTIKASNPDIKIEMDRTNKHPLNIFLCDLNDVQRTDSGDATEAFVRRHRHQIGHDLYIKYMVEAAIMYIKSEKKNIERGIAICHEMYESLGDAPNRRDTHVLISVAYIGAAICTVDAPFMLSLRDWHKDMVGVFGPYSIHVTNFDMSTVFAHIRMRNYTSALPIAISVVKRMREIKPKHHKQTLKMTCCLAKIYCALKQKDKAQPLIRYLIKQKYPLTYEDKLVFWL